MKVKISAVIITFNEEKNIGRCLKSLGEVVDEIVVVDSFSTDNTSKICMQYGAKFISHSFEGHIQQKNWAITQASNKYVLSLDADEALSEDLKKSILKIKNNWNADGFSFNRLNNYCGKWIKHGLWYPDIKLRLWDSTKGKWGGINPHDKFELSPNSSQIHLKGDLLHYSYYSLEEYKIQAKKFANISAKAYFEVGKKSSYLKIFLNPIMKFVKGYFFKLGFLDGKKGFEIARISYWETKEKYKKLMKLQND